MDFGNMMNNPAMASMASRLMSDPEMLALIQKPGLMEKFQSIMSSGDPQSAIMEHMGDQDFMQLVMKLQQMQMQDGGMGGGGGSDFGSSGGGGGANPWASMAGAGGGSNINAHSGPDPTVVIHNEQQFNDTIAKAGSKMVAVDFTASWCGPCKRISPVFHSLAQKHSDKITFVKVDGDENKSLILKLNITGFPTFHFYVNGSKVDEFSGADTERLTRTIEEFANKPDVIICPYKHFPLKENELVKYADMKWEPVENKLNEYNNTLNIQNNINTLNETEYKEFQSIISKLKDKGSWHNQSMNNSNYEIVDKLLNWPNTYLGPVLNFLRIFVLHPAAAQYYAKQLQSSDEKTNNNNNNNNNNKDSVKSPTISPGKNIVTRLCECALAGEKPVDLLSIRTLCNMFNRRVLLKAVVLKSEEISDCITNLINKTEDNNLLISALCLFINFAIIFREDATYYESGKIQVLSATAEMLKLTNKLNSKLAYTLYVIIGSLCYLDNSCTEMANGLEIADSVTSTMKQFESDQQTKEAGQELLTVLKGEQK